MVELKHGLLSWSPSYPLFLPPKFLTRSLKIQTPVFRMSATLESVNERQLTARERRKLRNERREGNRAYNWREEVEERLIKKPKKRYASWTDELNLDNLALLGPQWWIVRVSRVTGNYTAERLARSLARNFPSNDFQIYVPSVQTKRKLKNGSITVKPKPLFPGCVFLKCVLNKDVHDFIRECDGVGGFVGSMVGNTKRQINKPRPVDAEDIEAIVKQSKEEQEKANQSFLEEHQEKGSSNFEEANLESPLAPVAGEKTATPAKSRGKSRKTKKPSVILPSPGSTIKVISGAFAGFSGVVKKPSKNTGLVTVCFTLFGKETLADLNLKEITTKIQ